MSALTEVGAQLMAYLEEKKKIVNTVLGYVNHLVGSKATVYIFGGYEGVNESGEANYAHKYNVDRYTWNAMPRMPTPRVHCRAVNLDGLIHVIGGFNNIETCDTVDVFNPSKNTWTTEASRMNEARHSFGAAVFNRKIFVFGGADGRHRPLATCEVYNPETRTWKLLKPMASKRMGCCAIVPDQKRIFVIGGQFGHGLKEVHESVAVFNPSSMEWENDSKIPPMNIPRSDFGCECTAEGIVVFAGEKGNKYLSSTEIYSFLDQKWREIGECNRPRNSFGSFSLNGNIYILGGYSAERLATSECLKLK
ncbi:hypothetical protein AAMO2058_000388300 [Amorphochlora amoebiformis]